MHIVITDYQSRIGTYYSLCMFYSFYCQFVLNYIIKMSQVWNVFERSECGRRAICQICFKYLSNSGSNTRNLWNHLKSVHKYKYYELDRLKKGTQNIDDPDASLNW